MNIVFMGTPDFAVPCLKALVESGENVTAVFSQPDKPKGRGYKLTPPPVKEYAVSQNIPVYQPASLKKGDDAEEAYETLKKLAPDLIVVVAYGKILPKRILDLPKILYKYPRFAAAQIQRCRPHSVVHTQWRERDRCYLYDNGRGS